MGGVSKYVIELNTLNKLQEFNFLIETACIYSNSWNNDISAFSDIGATFIPIRDRRDFTWVKRTLDLIDSQSPDLLLVHGFNGPVIARICQRRISREIKFLCTYHGLYSAPKLSRKPLAPIFNYLQEYIYRNHACAVVSVCNYSKQYLIRRGVPAQKITVIHNGLSQRAPKREKSLLRKELCIEEDIFLIGAASRLDPIKGLKYLIEAAPYIINKAKHARLVLFGQGSLETNLKRQCAKLGISEKVYFVGYKPDIPLWLNAIDLYVLPSLAEFHSIGLLEAMRAGLPIVATNVGGNPESIQDGDSGLLVSPRDSAALANKISMCIADKNLRDRMGIAARQRFEDRFTLEKYLRNMANWLLSSGN